MVNLFFQSIQFCILFILLGVFKLVFRLFIYLFIYLFICVFLVTNLLLSTTFRCLVLRVETKNVCGKLKKDFELPSLEKPTEHEVSNSTSVPCDCRVYFHWHVTLLDPRRQQQQLPEIQTWLPRYY